MKLVVAIVQDYDASRVLRAMLKHNFRVTQISSTGGFLRVGNTTFFVGVRESRVAQLLEVIEENCSERTEILLPTGPAEYEDWVPLDEIEVKVGGATVLILDVVRFERL